MKKIAVIVIGLMMLASAAIAATSFQSGPQVITYKTKDFTLAATGTVIPAVAGKMIKVYAIKLFTSAAISVSFRDGSSTVIEGAQPMAANSGYMEVIEPPVALFSTTAGNSLDLVTVGTGTASGRISYWDSDVN